MLLVALILFNLRVHTCGVNHSNWHTCNEGYGAEGNGAHEQLILSLAVTKLYNHFISGYANSQGIFNFLS